MRCLGVIVNVFNAAPFLRAALDSLLGQTYGDLEVVAVDDGSTDGSLDILRSYGDLRLRVLVNERNLGIPATLNRGLAALDTEWVARFDADDVARADRFERQLARLAERPDLTLVASDALYIDAAGRAFATCEGPTEPEAIRARLATGDCIVHSSVVYRREAVLGVGGYRVDFPLASDYDLWLRLSERHALGAIAEPLVSYRIHRAQVSTQRLRLQRTLADRGRREAAERRRSLGLPSYGFEGGRPSMVQRLRGTDGTLGNDLTYWSNLYAQMGRADVALATALRGLLVSPLSRELWRSAGRHATHARIRPASLGRNA